MSDPGTILLVGGKAATVRKAQELGMRVVLIQHRDKLGLGGHDLADATIVADYTDWDVLRPLAEAARAVWDVRAVLSLTEAGLENAARLNDLFGFGGTPHAVIRRLRDKAEMRRHLAERGAATIPFGWAASRDSLAEFGERAGYPFIVKPTDATASFGVLRVDSADAVDAAWARICELRGRRTDRGSTLFTVREFLMEAYVDGPEFSVEAFSFAGRHVVVTITEKLVADGTYAELGHTMPARLAEADSTAITKAVGEFLDAVGLTDGPTHTEVRVGPHGPVVIESHNRVGGDSINDLVEAAFGVDLAGYAVGWPLRLVPELPDTVPAAGAACIRFLHRDAGIVTGVYGLEEVRGHPRVIAASITAATGDEVRALRDNWDRLGYVAVTGPDAGSAAALCEWLAGDIIRIDVLAADRVATA
jgi:biotin carboxylase